MSGFFHHSCEEVWRSLATGANIIVGSHGLWGRKHSLPHGDGISEDGGVRTRFLSLNESPSGWRCLRLLTQPGVFSDCCFRRWGEWSVCTHLKLHTRNCNPRGKHLFSYPIYFFFFIWMCDIISFLVFFAYLFPSCGQPYRHTSFHGALQVPCAFGFFCFVFCFLFFVFLPFLGPLLQHVEVPRPGVQSEL